MNLRIVFIITLLLPVFTFGQSPVKSETQLKQELFELNKHKFNHHFEAVLPEDNFLLIDFHKWSYWPEADAMNKIFDVAAKAVQSTTDSFKNPLRSKRIDIHLPVKNRPITMRLVEHNDGSDLLMLDYDKQMPLKLGMDTIRILKTYKVEKDDNGDEQRAEILYTFVLKDLKDIAKIAANDKLINDVATQFDNVVNEKRQRWAREDTWYHDIHVAYSPLETNDSKKLTIDNKGGFFKGFDAKYYVGASLFRNDITPFVEMGFSYKWPSSIGEYAQIRISASGIGQFERISESVFNFYNTTFVNLEWGTLVNKTGSVIPIYETSLGMGYMFTNHPSLLQHKAMKLFWHYSLSPSMRITPEFYVLFRKNQENLVWGGLTVALRIL
ncbi:MAG: hypothetical protein H6551_02525 [Chitinophagales bacterium]|nr:hypothetical protein [Chitinophagaceae bacterium]MCB9063997.1 hypothetical protein [Chitinophagales bacterium]